MISCVFEDGGKGKLRHVTINVIVFNKTKSKVLLVKRSPKYSEPNKWSPPGGFMSRDETLEEAAAREVKEETGHIVSNLNLIRINDNPNRPKEDRQNVDFIFIAQTDEQNAYHDDEVSRVSWIDINDLPPEEEFAFDHFENVQLGLKYNRKTFAVPIIGMLK